MDANQLAAIIAALAFLLAAVQYSRSERWKRIEFVGAEMKAFTTAPNIVKALLMLDWEERQVLLHSAGDEKEHYVTVDDQVLTKALSTSKKDLPDGKFTRDQAAIRDIFDELFSSLERFEHYLATGLVKQKDLEPYLHYWIQILSGREDRKRGEFLGQLWSFVKLYHYDGVEALVRRFVGEDWKPPEGKGPSTPAGGAPTATAPASDMAEAANREVEGSRRERAQG